MKGPVWQKYSQVYDGRIVVMHGKVGVVTLYEENQIDGKLYKINWFDQQEQDDGVYKFSDFVNFLSDSFAPDIVDPEIAALQENQWNPLSLEWWEQTYPKKFEQWQLLKQQRNKQYLNSNSNLQLLDNNSNQNQIQKQNDNQIQQVQNSNQLPNQNFDGLFLQSKDQIVVGNNAVDKIALQDGQIQNQQNKQVIQQNSQNVGQIQNLNLNNDQNLNRSNNQQQNQIQNSDGSLNVNQFQNPINNQMQVENDTQNQSEKELSLYMDVEEIPQNKSLQQNIEIQGDENLEVNSALRNTGDQRDFLTSAIPGPIYDSVSSKNKDINDSDDCNLQILAEACKLSSDSDERQKRMREEIDDNSEENNINQNPENFAAIPAINKIINPHVPESSQKSSKIKKNTKNYKNNNSNVTIGGPHDREYPTDWLYTEGDMKTEEYDPQIYIGQEMEVERVLDEFNYDEGTKYWVKFHGFEAHAGDMLDANELQEAQENLDNWKKNGKQELQVFRKNINKNKNSKRRKISYSKKQ